MPQQYPYGFKPRPIPGDPAPKEALTGLQKFYPPQTERAIPGSGLEPSPGLEQSPELQLHSLQGRRMDELDDRIFGAQRVGDAREVGALQGLRSSLGADIQEGPIEKQRPFVEDYEKRRYEAGLGGFASPQEQAGYEQSMAAEKLRLPLQQEKIRGEYDLAKQQEASRGQLGVAQEYAKSNPLFSLLNSGNLDINNIRSLSSPRGGSVSFGAPRTTPGYQQRLTRLENARRDWERSRWFGQYGAGGAGETAAMNQAIADAIAEHPADEGVKDMVRQIVASPQYAQLPASQILNLIEPADGQPITPDEAQAIRDLLGIVRGRDF